ncbi:MAG: hypothetical protein WCA51_02360 [Dehalococcoidia bacterium]
MSTPVLAADTGFKLPTVSVSGGGFNSPDRAWVCDETNQNARYAEADENDSQRYSSFTFGIPSGASIQGIEVQLEGYRNGSSSKSLNVSLSYNGGSSWAPTTFNTGDFTTSETTKTVGGPTINWGRTTWSADDFSDTNFRIGLTRPGSEHGTVYLDCVKVKVYYTPTGCTPADCNDGLFCTDDSCVSGVCQHTNNTLACNDGNACTTSDTCSGGVCVGGAAPNCNDSVACTTDSCDPVNGCVHTPVNSACADGTVCNGAETCDAVLGCQSGTALNCDDGVACTTDSCDPVNGCVHDAIACAQCLKCDGGTCAADPAQNNNPCDDGDPGTVGDVCSGGVCLGTPISGPEITVINANGSEEWAGGTFQTITWSSLNVSGNVRIELSRDNGANWQNIVGSTPNDGSQPWMVTGPATTQALIKISSISDPTCSDISDAVFTITVPPCITVTSPNGGQNWAVGTFQMITWERSGRGFDGVRIELSRDSGNHWQTIIGFTGNDGSQQWRVTGPATTQALARVTRIFGPACSDTSNAVFTITAPPPPPPPPHRPWWWNWWGR